MQLYNDQIKTEIRERFIQKIDALISSGKAESYREVCENINITPAQLNQVKSGASMPTLEMFYNLQMVYKVSVESILFVNPPKLNLVFIKAQLSAIQDSMEKIEGALSV